MDNLRIIIPAIKKNVAFPDDLVKKLAGISLLQRAINTAISISSSKNIYVVTDSEEIVLICQRNNISYIYNKSLKIYSNNILGSLFPYISGFLNQDLNIIFLSPYIPLIKSEEIRMAYHKFLEMKSDLMVPILNKRMHFFNNYPRPIDQFMNDSQDQNIFCELNSFLITKSEVLFQKKVSLIKPDSFQVNENILEIKSYHDWWICEKLINRRRIVFRVIGNKAVGMGHIFRSLALAHEISDHEIRFVCDNDSKIATSKLAGYDYWLGIYPKDEIEDAIIEMKPDLVINDILDTESRYINSLQKAGIIVVNFEDLGSGAAIADMTINDLYDDPVISGENILWGKKWFFLRDEFSEAKPRKFHSRVKRLLIAFGGTDPSDYTFRVLKEILDYCSEMSISIDVITGEGYIHTQKLEEFVNGLTNINIRYTHATGVISKLMEQADIAICSNGRTVYELAHMNIPAIVFSHHERETTHQFSHKNHGFIPLGLYRGDEHSKVDLLRSLKHLVEDNEFRLKLYNNMKFLHFSQNKRRVVRRIIGLLDEKEDE
jgi:spore coat polysaccharide biosynthesis predicted glycosyltransferase SpsG